MCSKDESLNVIKQTEPIPVIIKKSTLVSVEVIVPFITLIILLAGFVIRSEVLAKNANIVLARLVEGSEKTNESIERIDKYILVEKMKLLDRWSASMEIERQDQMYTYLGDIDPKFTQAKKPDIREIQERHIKRYELVK